VVEADMEVWEKSYLKRVEKTTKIQIDVSMLSGGIV